jgi:hypothetical protein
MEVVSERRTREREWGTNGLLMLLKGYHASLNH